jgi:hypothetical protein
MIQADAIVREDVHMLRIIASLVLYAVVMFFGTVTVIVGILMHGGWHDDGPTDDQSRTGTDESRAQRVPGATETEGQDAE